MSAETDPVVVVAAGPPELWTPRLPMADVVVVPCDHRPVGEWCAALFARLPGLALVLVAGVDGYTIGTRDGTLRLWAGSVGDPHAAARTAHDRWVSDHDAADSDHDAAVS